MMIAMVWLATGCDKTEKELTNTPFRVTIISEVCGNAIVQIRDSAFYQYGANGYVKAGITYDHVFTTSFSCADLAKMQTLTADKTGLVIKVTLTPQSVIEPQCIRCAATVPDAPGLFQNIALTSDWSN